MTPIFKIWLSPPPLSSKPCPKSPAAYSPCISSSQHSLYYGRVPAIAGQLASCETLFEQFFLATLSQYNWIVLWCVAIWAHLKIAEGTCVCNTCVDAHVMGKWYNTTEILDKVFGLVISVYLILRMAL